MNTSLFSFGWRANDLPIGRTPYRFRIASHFLVTLIMLVALLGLGVIVWPQSSIDLDEYAIYSAILNAEYAHVAAGEGLIAIAEHTILPREVTTERNDLLSQQLPNLTPATLADFLAVNDQPYSLLPRLTVPRAYALISFEELKAFSQDKAFFDFWDAFHARYPGPLIRFSRVGFNQERTQALVYYSNYMFGRSGMMSYLLLEKSGGVWVISGSAGDWIS
jgi:hypothetical protein